MEIPKSVDFPKIYTFILLITQSEVHCLSFVVHPPTTSKNGVVNYCQAIYCTELSDWLIYLFFAGLDGRPICHLTVSGDPTVKDSRLEDLFSGKWESMLLYDKSSCSSTHTNVTMAITHNIDSSKIIFITYPCHRHYVYYQIIGFFSIYTFEVSAFMLIFRPCKLRNKALYVEYCSPEGCTDPCCPFCKTLTWKRHWCDQSSNHHNQTQRK